jgi:hypothetical protein
VPTPTDAPTPGSGWLEGGDPRRRLDLECGEDGALRVGRRGGLLDGAGGALRCDEVEPLQLGCDPPPALPGGAFGDPDQEEGEPADDDVRLDAVLEPVEDGAQLECCLQVAEGAFGLAQVLVAERDLLGAGVGVGGGGQVLAVEARLGRDLASVDQQPAGLGLA